MAVVNSVATSKRAAAILLDYRPINPKNRLLEVRQALLAHGLDIAENDILEYHRFEPGDFSERLRTRLQAQRDV